MTEPAALLELRELLAAFVERPRPGILVVACSDADMIPFVHSLDTLDVASPADRFVLHFDPFVRIDRFIDTLADRIQDAARELGLTVQSFDAADPIVRLRIILDALLANLPDGDHRLVVALAPSRIDDPAGFAELAESLLADPFPDALRIVLRDDLERPRHFLTAEACPSDQVIAHRFHIPIVSLMTDIAAVATNGRCHPDTRAQALIQLGVHAYRHDRHAEAIKICEAAVVLTENPQLLALALAFRADALRALGDLEPALASARLALEHAMACETTPVIHQAAMTLAELSHELGDVPTAVACFALAERTAPHNPELQAIVRERRLAITPEPPC